MPAILKSLLKKVLGNSATAEEHLALVSHLANFPVSQSVVAGLRPNRPLFEDSLWSLSTKPHGGATALLGELTRGEECISARILPSLPEVTERQLVIEKRKQIGPAPGPDHDTRFDLLPEAAVRNSRPEEAEAFGQHGPDGSPAHRITPLPIHGSTTFQFLNGAPVGEPSELILCRFSSCQAWSTEELEFALIEGKLSPAPKSGRTTEPFNWQVGILAAKESDEDNKRTRKRRNAKPRKEEGLNGRELFVRAELVKLPDESREITVHFYGNDLAHFSDQRQPLIVECELLDQQGRALPLAINPKGTELTRLISLVDWDNDPAVTFPLYSVSDEKLHSQVDAAAKIRLTLRHVTEADLDDTGLEKDEILRCTPELETYPVDVCANGNWISNYPLGELFSETEEPTIRFMRIVPRFQEEADGNAELLVDQEVTNQKIKDESLSKLIDSAMKSKQLLLNIRYKFAERLERETYLDRDDLLQDVTLKLANELRLGKELDLIIKVQEVLRTSISSSHKLQEIRAVLSAAIEQRPYLQNLCKPLLTAIFQQRGHTKAFRDFYGRIVRAYMMRIELHMLADDETCEAPRTRSWLYKAALNHCIELYRPRKNRSPIQNWEGSEEESCLFDLASTQLGPEEIVLGGRIERELLTELDSWPNADRRKVFLLHSQGYSDTEIAEALNLAIGTVTSHKSRARKSLIKCLELFLKDVPSESDLKEHVA